MDAKSHLFSFYGQEDYLEKITLLEKEFIWKFVAAKFDMIDCQLPGDIDLSETIGYPNAALVG